MGSREEDDISDMKHAEGHQSKPTPKILAKSASFPSTVPAEDDGIVTALQRMFSEDSVQTYSRSISLPVPLKLVSALKGSREKQGLPPKKLTVKWAPDVYNPPPTSVLHTVGNKRQQKTKKKTDKKKNGKKGKKGNNAGRGSGGKDNKRCGGGGSSDRSYKPPSEVHQDRLASSSIDLDGFNIDSPDPHCGSSFLKKSPTNMHYPVAEAL
ncbi:uncharacterized protein LOC120198053 isoform X2 [Hibiscus syriacus]|uniref:uncharacterized protein LOC120198053 isoform X2 n=1 Tax=Hibiscus syriacus TaxID=106335 RepID=UPI0019219E6D|nr:uncharacterized protein LOC120198053 isoform X2 [Hibiscus syriacus]